ncbi:hypothetical protein V8E54_008216 [Elaphomyces granulatus]
MRFPGNSLIRFAERRQSVLSVVNLPATFHLENKLEATLVTKYGLRLQISDNIKIESIRHRKKPLFFCEDDKPPVLNGVKKQRLSRNDDKPPMLNGVKKEGVSRDDDKSQKLHAVSKSVTSIVSRSLTSVFTQLSYRIFPSYCTTYLWYKDWTFNTLVVDEEVIEGRYPNLATFYFEWRDIYETSFERQECHLGVKAPTFPQVEELVSWATEGFLMACWLALQDNVTEVEYGPRDTKYCLEKGRLDQELLRFLTDMEALLSAGSPTD